MIKVDITGRLTKDTTLNKLPSGLQCCRFSIASRTSRKDNNGKYITEFVNCVAWGKTAEMVADYAGKGDLVRALGDWQTRTWAKDGIERKDKVLVICPKRLRDNWTLYKQNDERNIFSDDAFRYDVLNHSDLSRSQGMSGDLNLATLNWKNYDLVVIDESHNFRNNAPNKKKGLSRYRKLMCDIIKAGINTKVLMREMGMEIAITKVLRKLRRKIKRISTARAAPKSRLFFKESMVN